MITNRQLMLHVRKVYTLGISSTACLLCVSSLFSCLKTTSKNIRPLVQVVPQKAHPFLFRGTMGYCWGLNLSPKHNRAKIYCRALKTSDIWSFNTRGPSEAKGQDMLEALGVQSPVKDHVLLQTRNLQASSQLEAPDFESTQYESSFEFTRSFKHLIRSKPRKMRQQRLRVVTRNLGRTWAIRLKLPRSGENCLVSQYKYRV